MVFVQPTCTKQFRRDLEPCTHRCTHVPGVSCKVFSFAVDFIYIFCIAVTEYG